MPKISKGSGSTSNVNRVTCKLDSETHDLLKQYSGITGVPLHVVLKRAVNEWMQTVGAVHMEVLADKCTGQSLEPAQVTGLHIAESDEAPVAEQLAAPERSRFEN